MWGCPSLPHSSFCMEGGLEGVSCVVPAGQRRRRRLPPRRRVTPKRRTRPHPRRQPKRCSAQCSGPGHSLRDREPVENGQAMAAPHGPAGGLQVKDGRVRATQTAGAAVALGVREGVGGGGSGQDGGRGARSPRGSREVVPRHLERAAQARRLPATARTAAPCGSGNGLTQGGYTGDGVRVQVAEGRREEVCGGRRRRDRWRPGKGGRIRNAGQGGDPASCWNS